MIALVLLFLVAVRKQWYQRRVREEIRRSCSVIMATTLVRLTRELAQKCESLCAKASHRHRDLFVSILVNILDFTATLDQPDQLEKLDGFLKPQRYQLRNFTAVGGSENLTYQWLRSTLFALPELKYLQTLLIFEDFVKECSNEEHILRSSFKALTVPLFKGLNESSVFFGIPTYVPGISEWELDNLFENLLLDHARGENSRIILWIADKVVEEAISEIEEFAPIIAATPENLVDLLGHLNFLASDRLGRFRIVINSKKAKEILENLNEEGDFMFSKIPIMLNKEAAEEDPEVLSGMRYGVIATSGTIGFPNFVSMSTLFVIGSLGTSWSLDFQKNGVVVYTVETVQKAIQWLLERPFLVSCKNFRILISPETIENDKILPFLKKIREELKFTNVPIMIQFKERTKEAYQGFDHSVHEFPWVRDTDNKDLFTHFCFMTPLDWAKKEVVWPSSTLINSTKLYNGVINLYIKKVSCTDLNTNDAGKTFSPFIHFFVNDVKSAHKLKVVKENLFPVWENLDLQFEIRKNDKFRMEVHSDRLGGGYLECQVEFASFVPDLAPLLLTDVPLSGTWPLVNKNEVVKKKIRGSVTIEYFLEIKSKIPKKGKYFGKTVSESMRQAEEDKVVFFVEQIMYILQNQSQTEGLFRLPGSTSRVQMLQKQIDKGLSVNLETENVHDLCSLMKLYFTELPDSLIPSILYDKITELAKFSDQKEIYEAFNSLSTQFPIANKEVDIFLSCVHVTRERR
eukprot:TRINITY_DN10412_c0_g1_i2.p1 TRINITY_DN10412_c0_g1~~TRINITY_DN10412_c0_g1_i2.p1  ORF type:complete len:743 (-),score=154.49 TRINITY_DN10412_c0_g1_i2:331-2559(-)